jgi:hypothetical protein
MRREELTNLRHYNQTKASHRSTIAAAAALLICLTFGTLTIEAKSQIDSSLGPGETGQTETAGINDIESLDPRIKELGEAVKRRLNTYSDEEIFTLQDGETVRMKVKENITGVTEILITPHIVEHGTKFELEGLDEKGEAIEGAKNTSLVIHDSKSIRMSLGKIFMVNGRMVISKIQLIPVRWGGNKVVVEAKALFTPMITKEEWNAMLLTMGRKGQLRLDFSKIRLWIIEYKEQHGHYPESLRELKQRLPKDVYSRTGEDYHYEADRSEFILGSCSRDGIYGNGDDELRIYYFKGGVRSGQRHELYPPD